MKRFTSLMAMLLMVSSVFGMELPRKAPEFAVQMYGGRQVLLSQYRGKVVMLAFIYTTCPHCQALCQLVNRLQDEYGPKGFQPLAAAFNEDSMMLVPDFIATQHTKFPVGYASRDTVAQYLQISPNQPLYVPQIVFIDRKGIIRQQSMPTGDNVTASETNLRHEIEMLLKESAGASAPAKTTSKSPAKHAAVAHPKGT